MQEGQEKEKEITEGSNPERVDVISGILALQKDNSLPIKLPNDLNWLEELASATWNVYALYKTGDFPGLTQLLDYISSIQVRRETDFLVKSNIDNSQNLSYFLASLININGYFRNKMLFQKTNDDRFRKNYENYIARAKDYAKFSEDNNAINMINGYLD